MSTVQTWIDGTRKNLLSSFAEARNKLAAPYTAGSGQLTFQYQLNGIQAGSVISCGLNTFYVYQVNGQVATVDAGIDNSYDVNLSTGAVVRVNPRFPAADIYQALAFDLADLQSPLNGLFGIATADLTYNAYLSGYDLGSLVTNMFDIFEIKYTTPGPFHDNPRLPKDLWDIKRNTVSSISPSGLSLELRTGITPGYNLHVVYKTKLVMPPNVTDSLDLVGLQPSAYDLPPLGAAIRLMAGREIKRNFTENQGENRRPTEVPPGAVMQSSNQLQMLRRSRINDEAAALSIQYQPYWNE